MLRNPYTSLQKNCKKGVAGTGLAVHGTTIQHILNNKDLHGWVARKQPFLWRRHKSKHLKYAKENIEKPEAFWNNVLRTDKTKSLCIEEHLANCEAWRLIHYALGLCGSWGHRKYCANVRTKKFHLLQSQFSPKQYSFCFAKGQWQLIVNEPLPYTLKLPREVPKWSLAAHCMLSP